MGNDGAMPIDREPTPLDRFSAPALIFMSRVPRWLLLVIVLGLTAGGLLLENAIGALLLLVLAGFLGWLAAVGWPRLSVAGRVLRIVTVGVVVCLAFTRLI